MYFRNIDLADHLHSLVTTQVVGDNIKAGDLLYSGNFNIIDSIPIYGISPIQSMFNEELNKMIADDNLVNKVYNDFNGCNQRSFKIGDHL